MIRAVNVGDVATLILVDLLLLLLLLLLNQSIYFQNVLRDWQAKAKKDAIVNVFVGDLLDKVKTL